MSGDHVKDRATQISAPRAVSQLSLPLYDYDDFAIAKPPSPKRPLAEATGLADLFPYYAGFSFDWACSKVSELSSVIHRSWFWILGTGRVRLFKPLGTTVTLQSVSTVTPLQRWLRNSVALWENGPRFRRTD